MYRSFTDHENNCTLSTLILYNETQLHQTCQPHGDVHVELKCTMFPIQTAAYDPIFWLHHSFIDKVWAERQNKPNSFEMTNNELEDTMLEPFKSNYSNT